MGFLRSLRNLLDKAHAHPSEGALKRFRDAWGLTDEGGAASSIAPGPDAQAASEYDRTQWRRKLRHVFEKDPANSPEWPALSREAKALKLDDAWVAEAVKDEFTMLIRSHIADRRLSDDERATLDAVRRRLGWTEEEAAAIVDAVVADARRFFGDDVEVAG